MSDCVDLRDYTRNPHHVIESKHVTSSLKLKDLYDISGIYFYFCDDDHSDICISTDEHSYVPLRTGIVIDFDTSANAPIELLNPGDVFSITVNGKK